uniref:GNAT family N-acetyltransferase n=1 Tax=Pedobacter schmidteae TaxID=2201271 RepID=UPI000EAFAB95|nr:GNAT family N-acetyltransferase [Pedobacter schmidteae]
MNRHHPILLEDKSKLSEIYQLRVKAWQPHGVITAQTHPDGYFDHLDDLALHWVIEVSNKIIGAARLNILSDTNDLPCPGTFKRVVDFKAGESFVFYSRLIVDPEYQGYNMSALLDKARVDFIRQQAEIKKVIATAGERRAVKLEAYGFMVLDKVLPADDYKSMDRFDTYIIQMLNE